MVVLCSQVVQLPVRFTQTNFQPFIAQKLLSWFLSKSWLVAMLYSPVKESVQWYNNCKNHLNFFIFLLAFSNTA